MIGIHDKYDMDTEWQTVSLSDVTSWSTQLLSDTGTVNISVVICHWDT